MWRESSSAFITDDAVGYGSNIISNLCRKVSPIPAAVPGTRDSHLQLVSQGPEEAVACAVVATAYSDTVAYSIRQVHGFYGFMFYGLFHVIGFMKGSKVSTTRQKRLFHCQSAVQWRSSGAPLRAFGRGAVVEWARSEVRNGGAMDGGSDCIQVSKMLNE